MNVTNIMTRWMTMAIVACGFSAQAATPVNVSYTYLEPSEGNFEDKIEQHEFKAGASMTVLNGEEYTPQLDVGGAFQANVWDFDNSNIDDLDLYKVKVPVTGTFDAYEKTKVSVSLIPGIHSDFKKVTSDDFRLEGSAVGHYAASETLQYRLGLAYAEDLGDPQVFPVGGVIWQANEELRLDLVFPAPRITYALTSDLRFYLAGEMAGGEWNVGDTDQDIDVRQEGFRVGVGAEYQVVDNGWLFASVGQEGNRTVSVAVNDDTVVDEKDIDDAVFVQIGFRLQ